ncbi:MAG: hypothetical protein KDD60_06055 [Bdellovibrionales bacterium]|nr:hypothetical protein [Bdellovibrionales bacterium]
MLAVANAPSRFDKSSQTPEFDAAYDCALPIRCEANKPENSPTENESESVPLSHSSKVRIGKAFCALDEIPTTNQLIEKLKKYGANLNDTFAELDHQAPPSPNDLERAFEHLSPLETREGLRHVIKRLQDETRYLCQLDEVGVSQNLATGIDHGQYRVPVQFSGEKDSLLSKALKFSGIGGVYWPLGNSCLIGGQAPTAKALWANLAAYGSLPKVVGILEHELTHELQYSMPQRLLLWGAMGAGVLGAIALDRTFVPGAGLPIFHLGTLLSKRIANDTGLAEVHAYEATASSPANSSAKLDDEHEIIHQVAFKYLRGTDSVPAIKTAYDQIHTLRVFGLNDHEIAGVIRGDRYDKNSGNYPRLDRRVELESARYGELTDGQFAILRKALFAQFEVERHMKKSNARKIAVEELERNLAT